MYLKVASTTCVTRNILTETVQDVKVGSETDSHVAYQIA
jgi:hypothetical protein